MEVSWGMQGPLHPGIPLPPPSQAHHWALPHLPLSIPILSYTRGARLLPTVVLLITALQLGPAAGGT